MQYFFTQIQNGKITDERVVYQLGKVLRGKVWDRFFVLDGKGEKVLCEAVGFSKKDIQIIEISKEKGEYEKQINLFFGLPKSKEKFEFILQKGTELGVTNFIPLNTDFSQGKYPLKNKRNILLLKEASEQSERLFVPNISKIEDFKNIFKNGKYYLFDSRGENLKSQFDLIDEISNQDEINFIIGPEGGFSEKEISFAKDKMTFLTLGKNILRLETAIIVALARIK